jgi:hypothetical protein
MALTKNSQIDLNGNEMILDADGDTTITADTDDQIDFKVGGSDTVHMGLTTYNASDRIVLTNTSGNASMAIVAGTSGESSVFMADGTSGDASYRGYVQYQHTNDNMNFGTAGSEAMRIDSSGNVGTAARLSVGTTTVGGGNTKIVATGGTDNYIQLVSNTGTGGVSLGNAGSVFLLYTHTGALGSESFAERMRINSSGAVLIGQTSSAQPVVADIAGIGFSASGLAEFQVDGGTVMRVGRLTNDGDLVEFRAQTQTEGKITVSGATVSYQGFSGSHESSGIATDTEIGTVCSTIDELDTYVSGNKSGQTRAEHAKIKVSDTVGDSRVYGVLNSYSETDNKPIVSSVGIGSVRVTGACNGGDLLESNGDGTAKVQDDDIIRSKTIGKVTIGNSNAGVKLVSCVLYCG